MRVAASRSDVLWIPDVTIRTNHPAERRDPLLVGPFNPDVAAHLIERDERYSSPSYTRDYPLVVKRATMNSLFSTKMPG